MRCFIPFIWIFSPSFGQFPPRYEALRPRARQGSSIPIMTHREPIMTGFCQTTITTVIVIQLCINRICMLTMLRLIWCEMMDKAARSGPIPNSDMGNWYSLMQNIFRLKEWSCGWQEGGLTEVVEKWSSKTCKYLSHNSYLALSTPPPSKINPSN